MITTEKLRIFNKYGRDIDELARVGADYEKQLFDNNDWSIIYGLQQDIALINNGLAAQTFIDQTFIKLRENCDKDGFEILTNNIIYYKDFQKIAEILKHIKLLTNLDSDTVWSRFDSTEQFLADLNQDVKNIENCCFSTLDKVQSEFLPTSTYQEISISNGWGEKYIRLSNDFDKIELRLIKIKTAHNMQYSQKGFQWYAKLISRIKFIVS